MEEENPKYVVWFVKGSISPRSHETHATIAVYKNGKSPLLRDACVYRVKGEIDVIRRTYHELICVMQLVGATHKSGDIRAELDRDSLLAVVPKWKGLV